MLTRGDLVRISSGIHEGQTGRLERVGISDGDVRLTASSRLVVVPLAWLRREAGRAVTVEATERVVSR
jgi:hypothetical protein